MSDLQNEDGTQTIKLVASPLSAKMVEKVVTAKARFASATEEMSTLLGAIKDHEHDFTLGLQKKEIAYKQALLNWEEKTANLALEYAEKEAALKESLETSTANNKAKLLKLAQEHEKAVYDLNREKTKALDAIRDKYAEDVRNLNKESLATLCDALKLTAVPTADYHIEQAKIASLKTQLDEQEAKITASVTKELELAHRIANQQKESTITDQSNKITLLEEQVAALKAQLTIANKSVAESNTSIVAAVEAASKSSVITSK